MLLNHRSDAMFTLCHHCKFHSTIIFHYHHHQHHGCWTLNGIFLYVFFSIWFCSYALMLRIVCRALVSVSIETFCCFCSCWAKSIRKKINTQYEWNIRTRKRPSSFYPRRASTLLWESIRFVEWNAVKQCYFVLLYIAFSLHESTQRAHAHKQTLTSTSKSCNI